MAALPPPPADAWRYRVECARPSPASRWVVCPAGLDRATVYAAGFRHARALVQYQPLKLHICAPDNDRDPHLDECVAVVLDLDEPNYEAIGERLWRRYKYALQEADTVRGNARALVEPDEIAQAARHVAAVEAAAQVYLDGHLAKQVLCGLFLPPTPTTPRAGYMRELRAAIALEQETKQ